MREIADLVDDEHVRMQVLGEDLSEASLLARRRELLQEVVRIGEERLEAVLDRSVADRDREVRLPRADWFGEDYVLGTLEPAAARSQAAEKLRIDMMIAEA